MAGRSRGPLWRSPVVVGVAVLALATGCSSSTNTGTSTAETLTSSRPVTDPQIKEAVRILLAVKGHTAPWFHSQPAAYVVEGEGEAGALGRYEGPDGTVQWSVFVDVYKTAGAARADVDELGERTAFYSYEESCGAATMSIGSDSPQIRSFVRTQFADAEPSFKKAAGPCQPHASNSWDAIAGSGSG